MTTSPRNRRLGAALAVATVGLLVSAPSDAKTIEQRKKHQEQRIENGEKSGKLSPEEASKLRSKEDAINKEEQAMRDANGGKLSKSERHVVRQQERKTSRQIRHNKHDHNNQ